MAAAAIFVFWTSFFAVLSAADWWERKTNSLNSRLARIFGAGKETLEEELLLPASDPLKGKQLQNILAMAGLKRKSDLHKIVRLKRISALLSVLFVVALFMIDLPLEKIVVLSIFLCFISILIPRFWIYRGIFKRRKEIERALPDALDLFILCLEAGLSFDGALVRVSKEMRRVSSHLSRELTFAHQEILVGRSKEEALKNLAKRSGVEEMSILVGAILQSIKLGTNLVKTLKIQADVMRKKRREHIRAEILKTPVKLIFPLLLFIFPTLLIVILAPSLVEIFRHLDEVGGK